MKEKEFVTYELALRMKQVGFDEPCLSVYTSAEKLRVPTKFSIVNNILNGEYNDDFIPVIKCVAPTWQQAFRWFRDKYNLYPSINIYNDKWLCVIKSTVSSETEISGYVVATINNGHPTYDTYPEAELACLEKLIEIVEKL